MITPVELWRRGNCGDHRAWTVLGIRILAAVVWLSFGAIFKVTGAVPRHEEIVAAILGSDVALLITVLIGLAETALGLWFFVGFFPRSCAMFKHSQLSA